MSLVLQEFGISLAVKGLNPNALNPDFLKYGDVIPAEWELSRSPVYSNRVTQIIYKNGIQLVAQPNRIDFIEAINLKEPQAPQVAAVAERYLEKLPKLEYQGIGVNIRSHAPFPSQEAAHRFLTQQILRSGAWSESPEGSIQVAVQFSYPQTDGRLNLSINEAKLARPEGEDEFVILFSGSYARDLDTNAPDATLAGIRQVLQESQQILQKYLDTLSRFPLSAEADSMVSMPA
ncbi:hypothetical protein [Lyngbya confervoides]|uniref:Uncharacterized protein n=1 Tax=Lyngbya confervoides BDU141951 TaxID=1574623 RepID=A0ABD4SZY9_9CYAN|nr:hypothetical protein [Lyngbya confervoides]MCM1981746.1 hypothetical protein [Lyngbya confervoides BDU141951]